MAKLSPSATLKLNELEQLSGKVQRVHGLVEQFAVAKANPDQYEMAIRRTFEQLKMQFMGAGMDAMSQLCGQMAMASKRGMSQVSKTRILREGVGTLRFQVELEARSVVSEDQARQRDVAEKKAAETSSM